MTEAAKKAAAFIASKSPNFTPKIGIILGSGLGDLVNYITDASVIPYSDIPNFPQCSVQGHNGNLHLGKIHNTAVACLEGRQHFYEGPSNEAMQTPVRLLKLLGCEILLVTNSAGSLNPKIPTGNLVAIKDHINFQFKNPLIGPNDDNFGSRFVGMEDAYDAKLRKQLLAAAKAVSIPLTEGIYAGMLGPSFETPAEIRMLRTLGVDVVAMSLIPEVIVARHCDLKVVAISAISNLAAGLSEEKLSHELTLRGAKKSSENLIALVLAFLECLEQAGN